MSSKQYTDAKAKHEKRMDILKRHTMPSFKLWLEKIWPSHKEKVVTMLKEVMNDPRPELKEGVVPSLDEAYRILGHVTTHLERFKSVLRYAGAVNGQTFTRLRSPREMVKLEADLELQVAICQELCLSIIHQEWKKQEELAS